MARPRNILHNYFFTAQCLTNPPWWTGPKEFRVYAKDAVSALGDAHKLLQRTRELDGKKKVLRPRLKPAEYRILRLFQRYEDYEKKPVEADLDLPNTTNPDALKKKRIKTVNMTFGFPEENLIKDDDSIPGGATSGESK